MHETAATSTTVAFPFRIVPTAPEQTQILDLGDSDFYRARAGGGVVKLAKSTPGHEATKHLRERPLIQAVGCAHHLGHPPFGH
jgi:dGTPase